MAGLIEDAKWRTPQNGKSDKYLLLTLSDAGGQYVASAFDADAQAAILAAQAAGEAVLIGAELQWRPGDETPRVTVRGVQPLAALAKRLRCRMTVELSGPGHVGALATLVGERRGGRGEIVARVPLAAGGRAAVSLGADFAVDNEIFAKVERLRGVAGATLAAVG